MPARVEVLTAQRFATIEIGAATDPLTVLARQEIQV